MLVTQSERANFRPIRGQEIILDIQIHTESTYCQALLYEQRLQKINIIVEISLQPTVRSLDLSSKDDNKPPKQTNT